MFEHVKQRFGQRGQRRIRRKDEHRPCHGCLRRPGFGIAPQFHRRSGQHVVVLDRLGLKRGQLLDHAVLRAHDLAAVHDRVNDLRPVHDAVKALRNRPKVGITAHLQLRMDSLRLALDRAPHSCPGHRVRPVRVDQAT